MAPPITCDQMTPQDRQLLGRILRLYGGGHLPYHVIMSIEHDYFLFQTNPNYRSEYVYRERTLSEYTERVRQRAQEYGTWNDPDIPPVIAKVRARTKAECLQYAQELWTLYEDMHSALASVQTCTK